MYDETVKRLKNCATQAAPCLTCDMTDDGSCIETLMKQAADAIEELQADKAALNGTVTNLLEQIKDLGKPRWIPVTERLPECDGERVLVASNFLTSYLRVSICYFSKNLEDVGYDFDGEKRSGFYVHDPEYGYYERQCVRYWMPLPEPPKAEDGET